MQRWSHAPDLSQEIVPSLPELLKPPRLSIMGSPRIVDARVRRVANSTPACARARGSSALDAAGVAAGVSPVMEAIHTKTVRRAVLSCDGWYHATACCAGWHAI